MRYILDRTPPPSKRQELIEMAEEHHKEFLLWIAPAFLPAIKKAVKSGWSLRVDVSTYWLEGFAGLRVMLGGGIYGGEKWLHLSTSRKERLPSWKEFTKVKDLFLGEDSRAIQVFPPRSEWVNSHPYTLHLWTNLDRGDFIPDFRTEVLGRKEI